MPLCVWKIASTQYELRSVPEAKHVRIRHILWNPKVHYRIHKSPPRVPYLETDQSSPCSDCISWRSIFYYPPIYNNFEMLFICRV